jgi:hypothetical protein
MAAVAALPRPTRASSRWIIGRGVDLSLVAGSAGAGYLYLILYTALHVPIGYLWWFWSVGLDGTHIFATASRTFFDRDARARQSRLLFGSLLFFFALGPAMGFFVRHPEELGISFSFPRLELPLEILCGIAVAVWLARQIEPRRAGDATWIAASAACATIPVSARPCSWGERALL